MNTLPKFSQMLQTAHLNGYAVAAFNVYNLETITAGFAAAAATGSPVILALGEKYFRNMRPATARVIVDSLLARYERQGITLPDIGLHLDHCPDPDLCAEAMEAGFSSVMIDASHLPLSENATITAQVVKQAHGLGVEVEAELGGLAAGEASHEFATGDETLTDPQQAAEFVAATRVDALAVSVGTVHGLYKGEPKIDLDRLEAIFQRVNIPLVLHGGSGTPAELLRAAVQRGVAKVNVNTEISLAAVQRIRHELEKRPKAHFSELGLLATPVMEEVMTDYIRRFSTSYR